MFNFQRALEQLSEGVALAKLRVLSRLEQQGLIKAFEFSHELAWNVMKDYAFYQGNADIAGSRDATREALKMGLITDGEAWMEMIKIRNLTSHTYNQALAQEIATKIAERYQPALLDFSARMAQFKE